MSKQDDDAARAPRSTRRPSDSLSTNLVPSGAGDRMHGKRVDASGKGRGDIGAGMVPTAEERPAGKKHVGVPVNAESYGKEAEDDSSKGRRRSLGHAAEASHLATTGMTVDEAAAAEDMRPRGRKFAGTRLHEVDHLMTGMLPSPASQQSEDQAARTSGKIGGPAFESHLGKGLAPPEEARPPSGKKSFGRRRSDTGQLSKGMLPGAEPEHRTGKRHVRSSSESAAHALGAVGPLPGFNRTSEESRPMSRKGSFTRPKDNLSVGMVPTAPDRPATKAQTHRPRDNLSTGFIPGA